MQDSHPTEAPGSFWEEKGGVCDAGCVCYRGGGTEEGRRLPAR